jgi:hypothetical protein
VHATLGSAQTTIQYSVDKRAERASLHWLARLRNCNLKATKSHLKADEWETKFVAELWEQTLRIWQYRNDAFHADTEVQTKQYKQEALGRNRAQIRARFVNLQARLHEYQNAHFSHPERSTTCDMTVNAAGQLWQQFT